MIRRWFSAKKIQLQQDNVKKKLWVHKQTNKQVKMKNVEVNFVNKNKGINFLFVMLPCIL